MKIPEGWPTEEMIMKGGEAVHDCGFRYDDDLRATEEEHRVAEEIFRTMLAAAPTPPAQDEPVAWVINYTCEGHQRRAILGHNAIADYRDIDPGAVATPLYTHPQPDKLREAAKRFVAFFNGDLHSVDDILALVDEHEQCLRDALEEK